MKKGEVSQSKPSNCSVTLKQYIKDAKIGRKLRRSHMYKHHIMALSCRKESEVYSEFCSHRTF